MAARNPARLLAPIALVAAAVGVIVVIQASSTSTPTSSDRPAVTQRTATQRAPPASVKPRVYVVKAGDTLTGVAEATGVSLETIQELNPDVDPQALQTGQRLKLGP